MKSILDPSFRYTASFATDLRKTFARLRHQRRQESAKTLPTPAVTPANVASIVNRAARVR